jgi:hypothetical protein
MKKILLLALLCIAFTTTFAQPRIINETCCKFTITPICYVPDHPCLGSITYGTPITVECHDEIRLPDDDCIAPEVRAYEVCYNDPASSCDYLPQCGIFGNPTMCIGSWVILDPCVNCGPLGLTKISFDPLTGDITISDYYWP